LGEDGDAVDATTFNSQASKNFIFNYNTVESVLLFSAVLVNLSGIMFESGQLENGSSNDALAYLVIVLISFSVVYFCLVLGAELLFAFNPDFWLFRKAKDVEDDEDMFTSDNPLVKGASQAFDSDAALAGMAVDDTKNQEALQEMQNIIQHQKDEIKQLQQQVSNDNLTKGLGYASNSKKEKKKKKNFGGSQPPAEAGVEMSSIAPRTNQII